MPLTLFIVDASWSSLWESVTGRFNGEETPGKIQDLLAKLYCQFGLETPWNSH